MRNVDDARNKEGPEIAFSFFWRFVILNQYATYQPREGQILKVRRLRHSLRCEFRKTKEEKFDKNKLNCIH